MARTKQTKRKKENMLIPTGSTLFNLMCSDDCNGAFPVGKMVNIIGDSSSGKTFVALSIFAEMSQFKQFDSYKFIYDDAEEASEFNLERLFGIKAASRIGPPAVDDEGHDLYSNTIQDFHENITINLWLKEPVIYILDSFDALTSNEEQKKVRATIKAKKTGKKISGSYKMEKAKIASEILRTINSRLKKTKSLLVIISQTRDNIDPFSFQKKTRSGGRALKFYASHEIWLAVGKKIRKKIRKKNRTIGINAIIKTTKNKVTGKLRDVTFPIYYSYGIDDIGSCIDWLVDEQFWKKKKHIHATELKLKGSRSYLIKKIEDKNLEHKLKRTVGKAWKEIENALNLDRKRKYK